MAKNLTDVMEVLGDKVSPLGFTLGNLKVFEIALIEGDGFSFVAYDTTKSIPVLRELNMDNLRLALHIIGQMNDAKDWSMISPSNANKIKMDVENLRTRLKDISWLQKK